MTYEEIKEKYAIDKSGYVSYYDCPLCIKDENDMPNVCAGYTHCCDGYEEAYSRIQQYLNCKENPNNKKNTVVLYVDWNKKEILNEHEYNEMAQKLEYVSDDEFFNWLNERYSASDFFKMDEDDRKDIDNQFLAECRKDIREKCEGYRRVGVKL